jgi:hypothetical protein
VGVEVRHAPGRVRGEWHARDVVDEDLAALLADGLELERPAALEMSSLDSSVSRRGSRVGVTLVCCAV